MSPSRPCPRRQECFDRQIFPRTAPGRRIRVSLALVGPSDRGSTRALRSRSLVHPIATLAQPARIGSGRSGSRHPPSASPTPAPLSPSISPEPHTRSRAATPRFRCSPRCFPSPPSPSGAACSVSLPSHSRCLRLLPLPPTPSLRPLSVFFPFLSSFASRLCLRRRSSPSSARRARPSLSVRIPCFSPSLSTPTAAAAARRPECRLFPTQSCFDSSTFGHPHGLPFLPEPFFWTLRWPAAVGASIRPLNRRAHVLPAAVHRSAALP